jgi:hypothetical protein
MLSTILVPILAVLNNLPTAKLPLPINVTAPSINIPNIRLIEAKVTTNYSRDLVTLVKIYIEESKYSREDNNFDRKLTIFIIIHYLTSDSDPYWAYADYSLYIYREKTLFEKTP